MIKPDDFLKDISDNEQVDKRLKHWRQRVINLMVKTYGGRDGGNSDIDKYVEGLASGLLFVEYTNMPGQPLILNNFYLLSVFVANYLGIDIIPLLKEIEDGI